MNKKLSAIGIWHVLKKSGSNFGKDKLMKKSASLAFYTIFSMGPLLIVIVFIASLFYGQEAVEGGIYNQVNSFVGKEAAVQLQQILKNAALSSSSTFAAIVGIGTLLVGATTMFADMQDSINQIWGLKPSPKAGWVKLIIDRLLSFGVVASLGFLLLVSLGISALIASFNAHLKVRFPDIAIQLLNIINILVSFGITTILFLIIFKVLPDARIKWKSVLSGAIATAILFMIGKFGISFYLGQSNIGSTYGAAGSLVVLLMWVYYSSVILYFGAEFTKAFAVEFGNAIHPNSYAIFAKQVEVETDESNVQSAEKEFEKIEKKNKKVTKGK